MIALRKLGKVGEPRTDPPFLPLLKRVALGRCSIGRYLDLHPLPLRNVRECEARTGPGHRKRSALLAALDRVTQHLGRAVQIATAIHGICRTVDGRPAAARLGGRDGNKGGIPQMLLLQRWQKFMRSRRALTFHGSQRTSDDLLVELVTGVARMHAIL